MKSKFILIAIALLVSTAFILYSCSKSNAAGGGTTGGSTATISMNNMLFSPAVDTVAKGTVVIWVNNDGISHTATSDDGTTFNSSNVSSGKSFAFTATTAGTFTYHCQYHQSMGMVGTLVVKP